MSRNSFNIWPGGLTNPAYLALVLETQKALKGCESILDLGCGNDSPMRFVKTGQLVGADGYQPSLDEARAKGTHDEFHLADVRKITDLFPDRRFDACVALDVIEHLEKDDGWQMLEAMEALATKRVLIFTPNGFVPQKSQNGDLQEHLSGWLPDEFRNRGYNVCGMHGPKSLRGEYAALKRRPKVLWSLISVFAHYLHTRSRPEKSFSIFCCKDMSG